MDQQGQGTIRVGVCGAAGRMGQAVIKAVLSEVDLDLVMAVDMHRVGEDAALVAGLSTPCGVALNSDLKAALANAKPQVVVDFTSPHAVFDNAMQVLGAGVRSVIGTTGLQPAQVQQLEKAATENQTAVLIVPNFAIGAVLLMKFAQQASRYFDHAEIIELHHNQKLDAPSGTALKTAELMQQAQSQFGETNREDPDKVLLPGARGGITEGNIHIHSIRLPGLVAHQEVIFGGVGQTLTLRHDSLDRTSFMPGVVLAVRKVLSLQGLTYGLEHIL